MIHTVKGFSIVSKAEVDVFLEFSCFIWYTLNHILHLRVLFEERKKEVELLSSHSPYLLLLNFVVLA